MISVRKAVGEDAEMIAPLLRDEDAREVMRLGCGPASGCIRRAIAGSRMAGVFYRDEAPLCVFGVADASVVDQKTGIPWLIGTHALSRSPRPFLRETRQWVSAWMEHYSALTNYVDADYEKAIRWLRWLGFTIGDPEPYGAPGAMFCRIEMRS